MASVKNRDIEEDPYKKIQELSDNYEIMTSKMAQMQNKFNNLNEKTELIEIKNKILERKLDEGILQNQILKNEIKELKISLKEEEEHKEDMTLESLINKFP